MVVEEGPSTSAESLQSKTPLYRPTKCLIHLLHRFQVTTSPLCPVQFHPIPFLPLSINSATLLPRVQRHLFEHVHHLILFPAPRTTLFFFLAPAGLAALILGKLALYVLAGVVALVGLVLGLGLGENVRIMGERAGLNGINSEENRGNMIGLWK